MKVKMKVKVLKMTSNELKLEIEGEGHTLFNILQKTLLEDEEVETAGYRVPHPLVEKTIFYIQTIEKANPEKVLKEAIKKVQKQVKEFNSVFKKALKKHG